MLKIIAITASLALAGCASYGNKIDTSYAASIEKGVTTESQVVEALGSPMSVGITPDGKRFALYMYTYAQAKASSFIPVVGLFAGGSDTETQMLQIWYDANGVVSNYMYNNHSGEVKTGILSGQMQ